MPSPTPNPCDSDRKKRFSLFVFVPTGILRIVGGNSCNGLLHIISGFFHSFGRNPGINAVAFYNRTCSTTAPAAITAPSLTTASSITIAPIPIITLSFMVQPCTMALWAMETSEPIFTGDF